MSIGNQAKNESERDEKGRFVAGNRSGGRKKQPPEFRAAVLDNAPAALGVIISIMNSDEANNRDRLKAAGIIIERAYGKPDSTVRLQTSKADMLEDIRTEVERIKAHDAEGKARA